MPKSIWDAKPELVDRATAMEKEGLSCAAIAKALGNGLTQRAVVGKLYRLRGDKPRDPNKKPPQRASKPRKPSAITIILPPGSDDAVTKPQPLPPDETEQGSVSLLNATDNMCRWPMQSVGGEFYVCGDKKVRGSYCEAHAKRGLQPPKKQEAAE